FADKCLLLGDDDYQVGEITEILNEKSISEYFSVISKKIVASYKEKDFTAFVFIDEVSDLTV
ncbi:TPA: ABC transporter ATP-binding protein, partial [Streptococcus pyogenes]|nr:ABC transporter ATP-binding protein [Streptococcus pyogenes]